MMIGHSLACATTTNVKYKREYRTIRNQNRHGPKIAEIVRKGDILFPAELGFLQSQ